jgi:hypothetical protein
MARLQDQDLKHQDVIIRWPPALRPIAPGRGALKIGSKDFKIDDLIKPLEIVALRGNVFQTLVDIEKPRLSDHPTDPLPKQAKRITKPH